jgi:hypothetical protein
MRFDSWTVQETFFFLTLIWSDRRQLSLKGVTDLISKRAGGNWHRTPVYRMNILFVFCVERGDVLSYLCERFSMRFADTSCSVFTWC